MDWGSILSNTLSYLLSPVTIAYALAATGLAVPWQARASAPNVHTIPSVLATTGLGVPLPPTPAIFRMARATAPTPIGLLIPNVRAAQPGH